MKPYYDISCAFTKKNPPFRKSVSNAYQLKLTRIIIQKYSLDTQFRKGRKEKSSITTSKSIYEPNLRWILACYWNRVNSNYKVASVNISLKKV